MNRKAITLIELLISLVIVALVIVGFSSIDLFSSRQILTSNKLLKAQNESAVIIETIVREANESIGDRNNRPARNLTIGGDEALAFWVDYNMDGKRDSAPTDREVAFSYRAAPDYEMRFYPNYSGNPAQYVVISKNAYMPSLFGPVITDNYVSLEISTCWDPRNSKTPKACGHIDNPVARMKARVMFPSASVR